MNYDFDQGVYDITGNGCFTAAPDKDMPEINMLALRRYLEKTGKDGTELTQAERDKFIIKKSTLLAL